MERVTSDGSSSVVGVYTSIPSLIRQGLDGWDPQRPEAEGLRLTLTKLDSACPPFGAWSAPHFDGLEDCLRKFVLTEEFSQDQCDALLSKLRSRVTSA